MVGFIGIHQPQVGFFNFLEEKIHAQILFELFLSPPSSQLLSVYSLNMIKIVYTHIFSQGFKV